MKQKAKTIDIINESKIFGGRGISEMNTLNQREKDKEKRRKKGGKDGGEEGRKE